MKSTQQNLRAIEKLDRSVLLRETGTPEFIRWAVLLSAASLGLFLVWASLIHVDEVAKSTGQLKPSLPVHPIQHFYGGTLSKIHVKDGDIVEQGDVLISLDTVELASQMEEMKTQLTLAEGRKKRLMTYLNGAQSTIQWSIEPKENLTPLDQTQNIIQDSVLMELNLQQDNMLKQIIETVNSHRKVSQHQILQLQSEMDAAQVSVKNLNRQIEYLKAEMIEHDSKGPQGIELLEKEKQALQEEMDIREDLVDQGLNSNIKFLSLQRQFFQIEKDILEKKLAYSEKNSLFNRQIQQIDSQLEAIPYEIEKKQAKILETQELQTLLESKTREQTLYELDQVLETENTTKEKLLRLEDRLNHAIIRAPLSGIVQHLKQAGAGAVVAPGELILNIVPRDAELMAEIHIDNKDIGHIRLNQKVRLKLTSFDFSRYGSLPGTITMIDATSSMDPKGNPYFLARVNIESHFPGEHRRELLLKSGMSLDADIITGQKTIMEYLLKPIYASTREAMQER